MRVPRWPAAGVLLAALAGGAGVVGVVGVMHRTAPAAAPAPLASTIPVGMNPQEVAVEPVAPGLDLLCRGLRAISPDDQVALDRGALLYDALYAEMARDAASPTAQTGPKAQKGDEL